MAEQRGPFPRRKTGFTIVELLVVIGIIVVLISLLVPAVSRVRRKAQDAATQAFMSQLSQAIDAYNTDFRAYPGPISNDQIFNPTSPPSILYATGVPSADWLAPPPTFNQTITMSENLVLGLLGGLKYDTTVTSLVYDPTLVGNGPLSLKTSGPVKRTQAYAEAKNLSWHGTPKTGSYIDENGAVANDSVIPEFVDNFSDPMPFLYLRAKKGAKADSTKAIDGTNNTVVTYDSGNHNNRIGQYDLHQTIAYTGSSIGGGHNPDERKGYLAADVLPHGLHGPIEPTLMATKYADHDGQNNLKYIQPFDAYAYFRNEALSTPNELDSTYSPSSNRIDVPHQKDEYILISAGQDRIYGTKDDITNFGAVTK